MSGRVIFHLTSRRAWEEAQATGRYRDASLGEAGFVHCSNLEQVERVGRDRFATTPDLVVLAVDVERLGAAAPVVDEPGDAGSAERFPHVHGPIAAAAVVAVHPFPVAEPERCEECGFDGSAAWPADAIGTLAGLGDEWRRRLVTLAPDALRRRPGPAIWSPLEYAAHTRDVTALLGWGLDRVLSGKPMGDAPPPDPDAVAEAAGYNRLDPGEVLAALAANAGRLARRAARAGDADWFRSAAVAGEVTTAIDLLRHAVHDATHHLLDVDRQLSPRP